MRGDERAEETHRRGLTLRKEGKPAEAVEAFREAVRLKPGWADAQNNLGLALRAVAALDEALAAFRAALRAKPDHPEARNNLGVTLCDKGQLGEAVATYRQVLARRPSAADTHNNLGVVLAQQGKRGEAVACYRRALALRADYAEAHNNLGNALRHEGKLDEAEACLRTALRLKPEYAEAYNNLAIILVKQERVDEAIANYHQALRLKPDYRDAHKNLGLALLGKGDYAAGWPEYEYRWGTKEMPARPLKGPRWEGGPLEGKTILLYAEQGLGDTIQFIRYAAAVAERGGRVVVECQKPLLGLLSRTGAVRRDGAVARGAGGLAFQSRDRQGAVFAAPLPDGRGSEGNGMGHAAQRDMLTIGIAWQGSQKYQGDAHRSVPLREFAPLAKVPGVRLVSLQKGFGREQLADVADLGIVDFGERLDADGAFLDSAALLMHVDLLVTSDTAVAHLAGALGVEVWLALSRAADWRWLRDRDDSPWYPTMRLFRQQRWGDWSAVFQRIADEVRQRQGAAAAPIVIEVSPAEARERIARLQHQRHRETNPDRQRQVRLELGRWLVAQGRRGNEGKAGPCPTRIRQRSSDNGHAGMG